MRHRNRSFQVSRHPDHVRALVRNQVSSLFLEGRICTTLAKAKEVRRFAERLITYGKKGTLAHRRLATAFLVRPAVVRKLFTEIAPKYMARQGGYTRIIRAHTRIGDAAQMSYLELVEADVTATPAAVEGVPASAAAAPAAEVAKA